MAIQKRNAAAVNLFTADLEQNKGELHMEIVPVNTTPYAAGAEPVIICTTGAVNLVVNLPQITQGGVAVHRGKVYAIKKYDAGAGQVIVTPFAGDVIDGAGSRAIVNQYNVIIIVAGSTTAWHVISTT